MNKKAFMISETAGCAAIYSAAVFLHFAYTLSSGSALGLVFGAVNESVWEHVKIFSAAYAGWGLLQLMWIKVPFRKYAVAKCIGLYTLMGGMICFFYAYTAVSGSRDFRIDIISSAIIVIFSQTLSFILTIYDNRIGDYFYPAVMLLLLYYLMFFSFSIFPPHAGLFRDPVSGGYGIQAVI